MNSSTGSEKLSGPSSFIRSLPKAELHLHLEGTVDPATLAELSRRHPTTLPVLNNRYSDVSDSGRVLSEDDARAIYRYKDFIGFLMAFKAVTERLRDPDDYELITYRMCEELAREGCVYAEPYVSVGVIYWRGGEFDHLFDGMERGRERGERDFGVKINWIFDAVRHFGPDEGWKVVEKAIQLRERNVVGIGIGGDEAGGPAENFREIYENAAKNGLHLTAHAGESTGPESIWSAMNDLKAERIGHGLHAIEDPELVEHLAKSGTAIEVCVSSNVRTGCCRALAEHPVRKLFDAGVKITIATDDPEMFGCTLTGEYQILQDQFGFSDDDLRRVARNSFEASFLPETEKQKYLAAI
ncbi:adenosine deaminase [Candidatus Koribacter versatilis Ellin345]|uniref:Adenosine deaminase n=1 Tax=Koribacter versatilis (strain Ellin345) TaxID=204669 RepID=Q1IVQ0_KORVE|nr:adenosine deaminase [Candidatus Koribacter versatilis]ABF39050.1 adenosine deaminase [Candidatus Koribacter versatilis Ellin345]